MTSYTIIAQKESIAAKNIPVQIIFLLPFKTVIILYIFNVKKPI